jgi:hypothetical protein
VVNLLESQENLSKDMGQVIPSSAQGAFSCSNASSCTQGRFCSEYSSAIRPQNNQVKNNNTRKSLVSRTSSSAGSGHLRSSSYDPTKFPTGINEDHPLFRKELSPAAARAANALDPEAAASSGNGSPRKASRRGVVVFSKTSATVQQIECCQRCSMPFLPNDEVETVFGNVKLHKDCFNCCACGKKFRSQKSIIPVAGSLYCDQCGKKAFISTTLGTN